MKAIEPIILCCWFLGIFLFQFDDLTKNRLKASNNLGLFPGFYLFSPRPLIGYYVVRYIIINSGRRNVKKEEAFYIKRGGLLDSNKRVIKAMNAICKNVSTSPARYSYLMLLNFVKNDALEKKYTGRIRFEIFFKIRKEERSKFISRIHDL